MDLGMIGLGRMGGPMAQRLMRGGHRVAGFARNPDTLQAVGGNGISCRRRRSKTSSIKLKSSARHLADDSRRRAGG